jgi:formylglycine-generating enzyme required for sulfatase activity
MGCSANDDECEMNESPWHEVTLSAFKLMATEFTEANYMAVTGDVYNQWNVDNCGADCALFSVPWADADETCYAAGGRLPTEAEWEYAARAGTTTRYYCGDDEECLDDIAWYNDNQDGEQHPVAQKDPNPWGFYDVLGHLMEWTRDWYAEDYYAGSPTTDPRGPATGEFKVLRGGEWGSLAVDLRVSKRSWASPDQYYYYFGFRCAK